MKTAVATSEPDFETWKDQALEVSKSSSLRFGQALFNTAPSHICSAAAGVMDLDPFHVGMLSEMYIINNFLTFAQLCWGVTDTDEIALAMKMVMDEPNARRR